MPSWYTPLSWYAGILECEGAITSWTATAASINYIPLLGVTFNAGDQVLIRFGSDPTLSTYSSSAAVSLVGKTKHIPADVPFTHSTDNARVYYQAEFRIGGMTTLGPIYSCIHVAENQPCTDIMTTDEHLGASIQANNTNRLRLLALCMQNAAASTGVEGIPSAFRNTGDIIQCKYNSPNIGFPKNEDGTVASGATSQTVTSQDDADITHVDVRRYLESVLPYAPGGFSDGNHEGRHKNATNRAYLVNAKTKYFGSTFGAGSLGVGDGDKYMAIRRGACLDIFISTYACTPLPSLAPDAICPSDRNQWTMDQTVYDALFNTSTGIAYLGKLPADSTVAAFTRYFIHNFFGGTTKITATTPDAGYGRGFARVSVAKADSLAEGTCENGADPSWTNPNGYTGDHATYGFHQSIVRSCKNNGSVAVIFKGHDHHQGHQCVDGVWYYALARPCDVNNDPYGWGFAVDAEVAASVRPFVPFVADADLVANGSGGHTVVRSSTTSLVIEYVRAYIGGLGVLEPEDGITTNGAIVDRLEILSAAAQAALINQRANGVAEDSTVPVTPGTTQPTPKVGEPAGMGSFSGQTFNNYTNDPAAAASRVYLGIRASLIDLVNVICPRRPVAAGVAGAGSATYTSTQTWTPPTDLDSNLPVTFKAWGASRSGGPAAAGNGGNGGGGGAFSKTTITINPAHTYLFTIPAAQTSSISAPTRVDDSTASTAVCVADNSGQSGIKNPGLASRCTGDTKFDGGTGGVIGTTGGGGGGESGWDGGAGNNGSPGSTITGGAGGTGTAGNDGGAGGNGAGNGSAGAGAGGGGGGAGGPAGTAGVGIRGEIQITYTKITTAPVRQTSLKVFSSFNRRIECPIRVPSASATYPIMIAVLGKLGLWTDSVDPKGFYLRYVHGTGTTLRWDNGITDVAVATDTTYVCPVNTSFDSGYVIEVRGRSVRVWAPIAGTPTLIIDYTISDTVYTGVGLPYTYWAVGLSMAADNISGQGYVPEAKYLLVSPISGSGNGGQGPLGLGFNRTAQRRAIRAAWSVIVGAALCLSGASCNAIGRNQEAMHNETNVVTSQPVDVKQAMLMGIIQNQKNEIAGLRISLDKSEHAGRDVRTNDPVIAWLLALTTPVCFIAYMWSKKLPSVQALNECPGCRAERLLEEETTLRSSGL